MKRRRIPLLVVVLLSLARVVGTQESGSRAAIELGRLLFWDPILSGNKDVACATCHHPDFSYADGRDLSLGTGAVGLGPARADVSKGRIPVVKRNSPTVLNTAFNGLDGRRGRRRGFDQPPLDSVNQAAAPMLWDNRIRSLESQALEPIKSREEMRGDAYSEASAVDEVVSRLRTNREYVALFKQAFGPDASIDARELGRAIAAFERSLVAMNSPFDRFRAGEQDALTAQQRRGCKRQGRQIDATAAPCFPISALLQKGVRENPLAERTCSMPISLPHRPRLRNAPTPFMHTACWPRSRMPAFYDKALEIRRGDCCATGGIATPVRHVWTDGSSASAT